MRIQSSPIQQRTQPWPQTNAMCGAIVGEGGFEELAGFGLVFE